MNEKSSTNILEEKATVWDRRIALLDHLKEYGRTTVDELARELKVSRRTILRDVTALMQRYNVEVERGRYGGVYLRRGNYVTALSKSEEQTLRELLTVANPEQRKNINAIIKKHGG